MSKSPLPPGNDPQANYYPALPPDQYGAPGAYGAAPPPYAAPPQAPQYGPQAPQCGPQAPQYGPGNNATQKPKQQKKQGGFLGSLSSTFNNIGKDVGREFDLVANTVTKYAHDQPASERFGNGNVVVLLSRPTGRPVQIVQNAAWQLVVDALGQEGPQAFNANWTVGRLPNYIVHLHNNFNYLSVGNGNIMLTHYSPGTLPGKETHFRVIAHNAQFIMLENVLTPNSRLGFNKDGTLRNAAATGRDECAHFAVKLLHDAGQNTR